MLRPRFSLRTLFVLVTLASIPMAWVAYHLNWIGERHEFLRRPGVMASKPFGMVRPYPWTLKLLGVPKQYLIGAPPADIMRARELFPEAVLNLLPPGEALTPRTDDEYASQRSDD